MYLLTSFKVVATIVLVYILISLIKAGEAKLAEENEGFFEHGWFRKLSKDIPDNKVKFDGMADVID